MPNKSSRQHILNSIAAASKRRLACEYTPAIEGKAIYKTIEPDAISCFINELEAISGQVILCDNQTDVYAKLESFIQKRNIPYLYCKDTTISDKLEINKIPFSNKKKDFETMEAGITTCEFLVARTGSVLISSASPSGRQMNVFPPIHIVIANVSQLVNYPEDALVAIQKKYINNLPSIISTITGPSRTADIEKTLVLGAHGPKEFIVFLAKV